MCDTWQRLIMIHDCNMCALMVEDACPIDVANVFHLYAIGWTRTHHALVLTSQLDAIRVRNILAKFRTNHWRSRPLSMLPENTGRPRISLGYHMIYTEYCKSSFDIFALQFVMHVFDFNWSYESCEVQASVSQSTKLQLLPPAASCKREWRGVLYLSFHSWAEP